MKKLSRRRYLIEITKDTGIPCHVCDGTLRDYKHKYKSGDRYVPVVCPDCGVQTYRFNYDKEKTK